MSSTLKLAAPRVASALPIGPICVEHAHMTNDARPSIRAISVEHGTRHESGEQSLELINAGRVQPKQSMQGSTRYNLLATTSVLSAQDPRGSTLSTEASTCTLSRDPTQLILSAAPTADTSLHHTCTASTRIQFHRRAVGGAPRSESLPEDQSTCDLERELGGFEP